MIKKIISIISVALVSVSCKTKQNLVIHQENKTPIIAETAKNVITNHESIKRDFKTAYIKSDIQYKDENQSSSILADIRIKKDQMILVTAKILGYPVAKVLLTPSSVKYYQKIGGKFFDGDYKILSNWLGTELNFQKVQNLLLGKTIDDLSLGKYTMIKEENSIKLLETTPHNLIKSYSFDPNSFWLNSQEIKQIDRDQKMTVNYTNYNSASEAILPMELVIFATQGNRTTEITIQNESVTYNEELTFPYSVPEGYKAIKIN
ncbi:DUF4292 domain-containing protein [Flavobacterium covae]|uniref:DUF4292 domain-containing protein n=1 Tax=Flavobacterium covae TaxID=2906076 RepID=UPI001FB7CAF1|nr:DUF4292 domain-containing protein [Flavobacterium covae]MCJ1806485.1 DUF4292 domain-containing protein [Flavobacterium covae]